ncbi:MAG: M23 family metallopeptidase [bacterium]
MLKERLRLVYISKNGSGYKQIGLDGRMFILVSFLFLFFLVSIIGISIGLFTRLYHNYRISSLENDREKLQQQLLVFKEKVSELGDQLTQIEVSEGELRSIVNLPAINSDIRKLGVGGPALSTYGMSNRPDKVNMTAREINLDLDRLERAVRLEKSSIAEIWAKLGREEKKNECFPSIRPILGGTITSGFGIRNDPLTGKLENHKGIDIPARKGTTILATGGGTVIRVKDRYTPHQGFGKYVVVDHGYGYKTLYAHCSKILVKRGEKVKRWQPIAEVGCSGKATGNHLHYEVHYYNKQVDPTYYVYN